MAQRCFQDVVSMAYLGGGGGGGGGGGAQGAKALPSDTRINIINSNRVISLRRELAIVMLTLSAVI